MSEPPGESTDAVPTRPVKESLGEIALFGLAASVLVCGLIGVDGQGFFSHVPFVYLIRAADIGSVVIDHIGWEFGVVVPTLLGFYVLILGGRRAMGERRTSNVRLNLSFAAELLAASVVPSFMLATASAFTDYRRAGALLAMVPVMMLTIFLAAQLGCFMAFGDDEKLDAAKRNRAWTRQRLAAVRSRSQRPVPLVVLVNVLLGTVVGACLYVLDGEWPLPLPAAVCIAAVCAALGVYAGFGTLRDRYRSKTTTERITAYILAGLAAFAVLILSLLMWVGEAPSVAMCVTSAFAIVAVSASIPIQTTSLPILKNWTLRGAAARSVARQLTKTYVRSTTEIMEITAAR